jgi:hypothetical protein
LNKSGIEFDEGGDEEFVVILLMLLVEIARIVCHASLSIEMKNDGAGEKVKMDHSCTQTDEKLGAVAASEGLAFVYSVDQNDAAINADAFSK